MVKTLRSGFWGKSWARGNELLLGFGCDSVGEKAMEMCRRCFFKFFFRGFGKNHRAKTTQNHFSRNETVRKPVQSSPVHRTVATQLRGKICQKKKLRAAALLQQLQQHSAEQEVRSMQPQPSANTSHIKGKSRVICPEALMYLTYSPQRSPDVL